MKTLLTLCAAMAPLLFYACSKSGDGGGETPSLIISPSAVSVGPGGNIRIITVNSSAPWSVSGGDIWCGMVPESGDAGQTEITVGIERNDGDPQGRAAVFIFHYGGLTKDYTVSQSALVDETTQIDLAPGESLSGKFSGILPEGVTSLKITGKMAAGDFHYIRDNMPVIVSLDLSEASVVGNGIPGNAFMNGQTYASLKMLETFIFPSGITSVGKYAFAGCVGLSGGLDIPAGVIAINDCAFMNCYGLTGELTLPASLETIGTGAFNSCRNLHGGLSIPANVTVIGNFAFQECTGFDSGLFLPAGLEYIGNNAFDNCGGLTSVTCLVPDPADITVGQMVFSGVTAGIPLYVPAQSVGEYTTSAPWNCFNIRETN